MRLTKSDVTAASRVMLPTYPIIFGALGINFILSPRDYLRETPMFDFADSVAPMPFWGICFLIITLVQVIALVVHRRATYQTSLMIAVGFMIWWSGLSLAATLFHDASPTAAVWPAFVGIAATASHRSLVSGET